MKGFIVVNSRIKDSAKMQEYIDSNNYLEKYEGRVLTIGTIEVLSGENSYESMLIIEFDSVKIARSWFKSSEYQKLKSEILDLAVDSTFTLCNNL